MKINKLGHKIIFFQPPFAQYYVIFRSVAPLSLTFSAYAIFITIVLVTERFFVDDHRPCFLYFLFSQTKQALGEFPRLAHNDDLKIDWDENVREGVNYKFQPVLWIRIILIRIRIRGSGSGKSGSGSDQKSKKITTFFFNKKYGTQMTQSYDFYCYLLAYYSYTYINQKSDLFFKII